MPLIHRVWIKRAEHDEYEAAAFACAVDAENWAEEVRCLNHLSKDFEFCEVREVDETDDAESESMLWQEALSRHSEYEGDEAPWQTMENEFQMRDREIKRLIEALESLKASIGRLGELSQSGLTYFQADTTKDSEAAIRWMALNEALKAEVACG